MQPPFRSKQEVIINAPLEAVWSFSMDLTKIPEFHPRVVKVDLLSGKTLREPGASYRCHLAGGKHTCIEKDIEIIPLQKIVTVLPEDTFGISKILSDYRVETTFQTLGHRSTKVEISHYYSTTTLKAKLLNLIAKGNISTFGHSRLLGFLDREAFSLWKRPWAYRTALYVPFSELSYRAVVCQLYLIV